MWRWWFFNLIRGRLSRQSRAPGVSEALLLTQLPGPPKECKWQWRAVTLPQSGSPTWSSVSLAIRGLPHDDPLARKPLVNWKNAILFYGIKNTSFWCLSSKMVLLLAEGRLLNIWKLLQNNFLGVESCFKDYLNQFALTVFSCCFWAVFSDCDHFGKLLNNVFLLNYQLLKLWPLLCNSLSVQLHE